MLKILGVLFLFVVIFIGAILFGVLRGVVKIFRSGSNSGYSKQQGSGYNNTSVDDDDEANQKHFTKDEGKYIEYEEIKEEEK